MDFQQALDYMQALRRFGIKLGNERFEALMARLGNPHGRYAIAHVTGTKGKGSTTAMVAGILQRHGFRVGGYFSPYVFDIRERVKVNGKMIPREDFARLVTLIRPHVDSLAETDLGQATEFELKTALGFLYFAEQAVDYAAIEVGIGGRLDATNIVCPTVTVITNVGLDHTHILGDTHAKIAFEKAGIIKAGIPCVTAVDVPEAEAVIRERAQELGAPVFLAAEEGGRSDPEITWTIDESGPRPRFTIRTRGAVYPNLQCGMAGSFQVANAACAVGAVEQIADSRGFDVRLAAVLEGLAATKLPGRMQVVRRNPTVLLDGAHNDIAASALRDEIGRMEYDRLLLVIGMVAGHEPDGVVGALAPLAATVYATQPTWNKAIPAQDIAAVAERHCRDVRVVLPPNGAAKRALSDAGPGDLVVVTGSFYVVGDVRPEELG